MSNQLDGAVINQEETNESELNNTSDIDWDEASLAKLLDFDDDDVTETAVYNETEASEIGESNQQLVNSDDSNNVINQSELFDDPYQGKTKPTLASNPFAKFGTVGLGLGTVFVASAFFLNSVMTGKPKVAPPIAKTTPQPQIVAQKQESNETETGKLKAELALGKQSEQIKAVEVGKSPKQINNTKNTKKVNPVNPTVRQIETAPPRNYPRESQFRQQQPVSYVPPPRVTSQLPIREQMTPKYQIPKIQTPQSPNIKPVSQPVVKQVDPMEQWVAMSRLGSYGSGEVEQKQENGIQETGIQEKDYRVASNVVIGHRNQTAQSNPNLSNADMVLAPRATPVVFANQVYTDTSTYPRHQQYLQPDPNLEKNILTGVPVQQLTVGMTASAKVVAPMVWSNSIASSQNKAGGATQTEENFVVQLTQPIKDDKDNQIVSAGSQIVGRVERVNKAGYAIVQATRLLMNGQEYVLPPGAITITGSAGNPLMASQWNDKGGEIASRDLTAFVFGSLAKVGKVLNEPEESSSFNSAGIGSSSSTTLIKRGKTNVLGAVLEGGFEPLTEQILTRNKAALAEIANREDVWFVRAGTDVQVVVNQSFEF
ncbi:hypothetical protein CAL7716_103860 (plasmid) [Calothrix sp. PCC 7716]|nr:hypothetical protein CAL7716_103860 [Calothrix sp. PCC 7716]